MRTEALQGPMGVGTFGTDPSAEGEDDPSLGTTTEVVRFFPIMEEKNVHILSRLTSFRPEASAFSIATHDCLDGLLSTRLSSRFHVISSTSIESPGRE